ncbi:MAG: hypothetical protein KC502_07905 [Myxococcales bacterium]|nr:hypothetical protein [Myxococcales bacterium]
MSSAADTSPVARSMAELSARCGAENWALAGEFALRKLGLDVPITQLHVIAETPLPIGESVQTHEGQRWTPDGGVPIIWSTPTPHFAPLWHEAVASATGSPPCVSGPIVLALLMAARAQSELIIALLAQGAVAIDEARSTVHRTLGPLALDLLTDMIAEAEWQAMRSRYDNGSDLH